jgi:hypothetical protein
VRLSGTEAISIELEGTLDAGRTRAIPAPLEMRSDRVSVLVLAMRGLGAPLIPRVDYREVLYRADVAFEGEPAWLAVRCDLDRALVRTMAAAIIRYPVEQARIDIEDGETLGFRSVAPGGTFAARLVVLDDSPEAAPPRRTFVVQRGRLFEIPWGERPAPTRRSARVERVELAGAEAAFGGRVELDDAAVVHRGRTHLCGSARAVGDFAVTERRRTRP